MSREDGTATAEISMTQLDKKGEEEDGDCDTTQSFRSSIEDDQIDEIAPGEKEEDFNFGVDEKVVNMLGGKENAENSRRVSGNYFAKLQPSKQKL